MWDLLVRLGGEVGGEVKSVGGKGGWRGQGVWRGGEGGDAAQLHLVRAVGLRVRAHEGVAEEAPLVRVRVRVRARARARASLGLGGTQTLTLTLTL